MSTVILPKLSENLSMDDLDTQFATRLNAALDSAGYGNLNNEQIGKMFSVTRATVGNWRKGDKERYPQVRKGMEICLKLNVSYDWLMTGRGDMQPGQSMSENAQVLLVMFNQMSEQEQKRLMGEAAVIHQQREAGADVHVLPRKD